jgi:hypothetical protein
MKTTSFLLLTGATLLFASCKKESTTEQAADTNNISYQLATTNSSDGNRAAANFLTFTGGTASISEIKFEAKGDNKIEYKSNVPQTVNLGNVVANLGGLTVPFGTYQKIEFKIKFVPTSTTPSIELQGLYTPTNGGAAVPVILQLHQAFELKFEKKTPTTIDANTNYTAFSTLALGLLNNSVVESALQNATRTNGVIVISSTSNTQLYNPMWSAFQQLLKVEIKKK